MAEFIFSELNLNTWNNWAHLCCRPVAHHIVPVKQRGPDAVKTCPIDRPRSTTPINPTMLDDFVSSPQEEVSATTPKEKMQIVLPRSGLMNFKPYLVQHYKKMYSGHSYFCLTITNVASDNKKKRFEGTHSINLFTFI